MASPDGTVVMKFGGTSVADASRLKRAAERIVRKREAGHRVVAVLSARGKEPTASSRTRSRSRRCRTRARWTCCLDRRARLVRAVRDGDPRPRARAISLTGSQAGIVTDTSHTKARILEVRADRIVSALDEDKVVLVAGFQGVSTAKDVTTLGRGGSDTTAVALAAAVGADVCEIYTDVPGSSRPTRASSPTPASSTSSPSRRCWRWRPPEPASCSCARSSTPATTACASTAARASTTRPGPSSCPSRRPWNSP